MGLVSKPASPMNEEVDEEEEEERKWYSRTRRRLKKLIFRSAEAVHLIRQGRGVEAFGRAH